ncbi:MAG: tetratricopeptide repeat protein [Deltaproteobacteria bacterium]|nr:tetratricopeptide repeat protein [Deltaproteobacteria bacterium]
MRLSSRGWSQEAAKCFREAVELDPDRVESWDALAASLAEIQDLPGALHAQLEAHLRSPDDPALRLNLGNLLHHFGPQLAIESLEAAAQDEDLAPDAHLTLGLLHADLGRHHLARHHLEETLSRDPDDIEALQELAALMIEQDEVKEAIGLLRRALELEPEAPELWLDLARAYATQRLQSPARDALRRAEEVGGAGPDLALIDALLAALEGNTEAALLSLQRAYRDPGERELPLEFLDDPAFESLRDRPEFRALLEGGG